MNLSRDDCAPRGERCASWLAGFSAPLAPDTRAAQLAVGQSDWRRAFAGHPSISLVPIAVLPFAAPRPTKRARWEIVCAGSLREPPQCFSLGLCLKHSVNRI